jgi:hypothetical protein
MTIRRDRADSLPPSQDFALPRYANLFQPQLILGKRTAIVSTAIGSGGEQPLEAMGKVRCESGAVPQL